MAEKNSIHRGFRTDLSGKVFNWLTVIGFDRVDQIGIQRRRFWKCRCECGRVVSVVGYALKNGQKSCGCWQDTHPGYRKHGATGTPEHKAWVSMLSRCFNANTKSYHRYGGRGITVCAEWRRDFSAFLEHIGPMPTPGLELDRINNDGNYEPGNVRWATMKEQARNRRNNRLIEFNGETICLQAWADRLGIRHNTLLKRLNKHGVEHALTSQRRANGWHL